MPEIQECHHLSGEFQYLLKVWVRSLPHLENLNQAIATISGVKRTQLSIVLSSPKDQVTGLVAQPS
jgi:Lrp/AsnC family transcriptional regulator, leucine-responsive regulatory protein